MQYRNLPGTDIRVSALCLGTMTWGSQNSEAEAHEQLNYAFANGINFLDTAEMYPTTPPTADNQGSTERFIGTWLKGRPDRDKIIVATKAAGPSPMTWVRGGVGKFNRAILTEAIHDSLRRLQTDYVDLYQLHWPERSVNSFGVRGVQSLPETEDFTPFEETLEVLDGFVKAGKIRAIGVSNETPWGVMRFLQEATARGYPRLATIQNPYNLLNRTFEIGLSEVSLRENVGLLAYAPLAAGVLTGKYLDGALPEGSRLSIVGRRYPRYSTPGQEPATRRYLDLAREHGIDPAQLAIAFVASRPFVTSAILGATSLAQLKTDMGGPLSLPDTVLTGIADIYRHHPDPCS